jgi:predicted nucleic acid-binding Zn ribbon protein
MSKEQQRRMAAKRKRNAGVIVRLAIIVIALTVFAAWFLLFMR